jgi:hypothetical protein
MGVDSAPSKRTLGVNGNQGHFAYWYHDRMSLKRFAETINSLENSGSKGALARALKEEVEHLLEEHPLGLLVS